MVRHSLIVNQLDERTCPELGPDAHLVYLQRYEAVFGPGLAPAPEVEPTSEQLAVLGNVLKHGGAPYCDFSIFGPNNNRMVRKQRLHGQVLSKDAEGKPVLSPVEIAGPPDIDSWMKSWAVFSTAMIMLDAADLGILELYKTRIQKLHDIFSTLTRSIGRLLAAISRSNWFGSGVGIPGDTVGITEEPPSEEDGNGEQAFEAGNIAIATVLQALKRRWPGADAS